MNYQDFHECGEYMAAYFVLDQSRKSPSYDRATLMLNACHFFDDPASKEARDELYSLAIELFDCEQLVQRLIATLRADNSALLAKNSAVEFLLARLERSDLRTKLEFVGNAENIGLEAADEEASRRAWVKAYESVNAHEQRVDLFMFRLRTQHWRPSNAETLAIERADAQRKRVA